MAQDNDKPLVPTEMIDTSDSSIVTISNDSAMITDITDNQAVKQYTPNKPDKTVPQVDNPELDDIFLQNATIFHPLTQKQKNVLIEVCKDVVSEDKRNNQQIADAAGVCRSTVVYTRQNKAFTRALVVMLREIIKGTADKPISNLYKLAEKDVKANEILLRIADLYRPTNRNMNLNAHISGDSVNMNADNIVDSVLIKLISTGWTEDRIIERIRQLKSEGIN